MSTIDWEKMPVGTMTNHGELRYFQDSVVYGIEKSEYHNGESINGWDYDEVVIIPATKWTYWGGGECPVPSGVQVQVVFRTGMNEINQQNTHEGDNCNVYRWWHNGEGLDIIAYRVVGFKGETT